MILKKFPPPTTLTTPFRNFASKAMAGYTHNSKDSAGRRLGLKKQGGNRVLQNVILARQRGFKWKVGQNVYAGKDYTLHSKKQGIITFTRDPFRTKKKKVIMHVVEQETPNYYVHPPPPFMYHPEVFPELAQQNKTDLKQLQFTQFERKKLDLQKRGYKNVSKKSYKKKQFERVKSTEFLGRRCDVAEVNQCIDQKSAQLFAQRIGYAYDKDVEQRFQKSFEFVEKKAWTVRRGDYTN